MQIEKKIRRIARWKIWFGIWAFTVLMFGNLRICKAEPSNAMELAKEMKAGWNLGNSLDCTDHKRTHEVEKYEKLWGNPVVTESDIIAVKKAGFDAVRVPVTYYDHCDNKGNIDTAWLDRVEKVVNYVLKNDMYCIITVQHDTGSNAWLSTNPAKLQETKQILANLWTQISLRFQNYGYKLVFEGMNEILDADNNWTDTSSQNYVSVNCLNQVFVDTVRKGGGYNPKRFLITNVYASATTEAAMANYELPEDIISGRILVDIHNYETSEKKQEAIFQQIDRCFISKGIPVVFGEYGIPVKSASSTEIQSYLELVLSHAKQYNISCFWWDDGSKFGLLQRGTQKWYSPKTVKKIASLCGGNSDILVPAAEGTEEFEEAKPGSAYTSLEWLELTGSGNGFQLNTTLDSNSVIEIGTAFTTNAQYSDLLYAGESSSRRIQFRQENNKLAVAYGWYNENVKTPEVNKNFVLRQEGNITFIDGVVVQKASKQTFSISNSVVIGKGKFRIYYCKIWKNGILVNDLVPAIDCNNTISLVDKVSGKFYYTPQTKVAGYENNVTPPVAPVPTTTPTLSITPVPTSTPLPTATPVPTSTPLPTATPAPISTPVPTTTPVPTSTPMLTVTPTPTNTPTINPSEIKKLSYIESVDSKSSIDTGIYADSDVSIEIEMAITDSNAYGYILQGYSSSVNRVQIRQEKDKLYGAYGWYNEFLGTIKTGEKYTVKIEGNKYWLNGKLIFNASKQSFTNTNTLRLLLGKGKIYSCKIWEDGVLKRDYIAVLDSSNTACLYDRTENRMYYSTGKAYKYELIVDPTATPTPIVSPVPTVTPTQTVFPKPTATPIPTAIPKPTATPEPTATPKPTATPVPTSTPKPTATPIPTAIPKPTATPEPTATPKPTATPEPTSTPANTEYERISYIEANTHNYIDTGIIATNNTQVYMKLSVDTTNSYGNIIWGDTVATKRFQLRQEKNLLYGAYGWYNEKIANLTENTVLEVLMDKNKFWVNNQLIRTANNQTFEAGQSLKFMGTKGRLYACRIWQDGQLVRDYIPVKSASGELGILELRSGRFYKM